MIKLQEYKNEQNEMLKLIKGFWLCHNGESQTDDEAMGDLNGWTQKGHKLYFINYEDENVGFVHLGSRGAAIDWLEDIFVKPEYQSKGIGSKAIVMVEEIVNKYSVSLYIEAAARNEKAIKLYRRLGYDCLNTVSVRKDFDKSNLTCIRTEKLYGDEFEIRKVK